MTHGSDLSQQPHPEPGPASEERSTSSEAFSEVGAPTYLASGDPALADYFPAWINNLADDVTLEGSMMDGAVQGAEAVRALLVYIRKLYERQCVMGSQQQGVFLLGLLNADVLRQICGDG